MTNVTTISFPDRDTVASKLSALAEADKSVLILLMENPQQDDAFLDGLHRHLDRAAGASFLNTLKLEKLGEWLGSVAPARLQIRLTEVAKSGQHPAVVAFRTGLARSGGLDNAYPPV